MSGPAADAPDVLSRPEVAGDVMRGGAQRTAGFIVVNLLTAAGAVLLLRHLGIQDFGRYGVVMALLAIVQGVSDAGLSLTGSRELAVRSTPEDRRDLLAHLLALRIVLTAAGVAVGVGFALLAGYDAELVQGTAIAGIGVLLLSAQSAMLLPLVVELSNGRLTINEILRQAALVGCFVALVLAGATLERFFAAQLVAAAIAFGCTPLLLGRDRLVRPRWTPARLRELAVLTLPLAVSAVLSIVYLRLLLILMSVLDQSEEEVGRYATSTRIVEIFLALPGVLVGIVLPVLSVAARDDAGRLRYVSLRLTQLMLALGVLLALTLATAAEPVVLALGGEEYKTAGGVLRVQATALVSIFATGALSTTLVSMGRTRALVACTGFGALAALALGLALIPPFGAKGAAVAAVAADVLLLVAVVIAVRRAGPGREIEPDPFVRLAAAAAPAVLVAVLSPLPALADATLAALVFGLLAWLLGGLPQELIDVVHRRVRRRAP